MISPIISTLKTLLSRLCEIIPNVNYKESVSNYDLQFAQLCLDYLVRLINFDKIIPFPRSTIPNGNILYGMCFPSDGGKPGYAAYCYTLSEQSEMELNIHHDWRIVRDPLGVLSVSDSEMTSLDAPGVNFLSDRKPEVHTEFKERFGKQMQNADVTKQVLQERVVKRTEFEDKYGICQLTTEEIDLILKQQNKGNDKLESNILASKSKNCKRSIPAHKILGRSLATDLALSISKS